MGRITGLGSDPQLLRSITVSANGQVLPNATVLPQGLPFTALMEQILESGAAATFGLTSDQEAGIAGAKTLLSAANVVATAADVAIQQQRIDTLVTGAPAALNTLAEIAAQIASDEQGVAGILAAQNRNTQQISTNTAAIGTIQRAVVVGSNVGNGSQAPVQVGGYANNVTGLESGGLAGGGNTVTGNDSGYLAGSGGVIAGNNSGAVASAAYHLMGDFTSAAASYGVSVNSNNAGFFAARGGTLPAGADYSAVIAMFGFTPPAIPQTLFTAQLYLGKPGGGMSLVSPDGNTRAVLTISNTGQLLLNGAAIGSTTTAAPTITNPTFTAA